MTHCTDESLDFQGFTRRTVRADFDAGHLTSDGGVVLVGEVDRQIGFVDRLATCFEDYRDPSRIEHTLEELLRQRIFGLVLGYEDLNDHEELRKDPLLATVVGKEDPEGQDRRCPEDRGKALAGKSTLNRMEWGSAEQAHKDRYRRIFVRPDAVEPFFVDIFLDSCPEPPESIVLDLDATDDPLHGEQEGRFFHGYYDGYCYLPLYIFCGSHLLCARLRRANQDASAGSIEEVGPIIAQIRERWPAVQILLRGDSGFAREPLMRWCEDHDGVEYVFGLAKNARLKRRLAPALERAHELCAETGHPIRLYTTFRYSTLETWSRKRRVVGKAQITHRGENPRFVVTSLPQHQVKDRVLYEDLYCARGDMENRIKEQQLDLFSTRTSGHLMRVNQIRLWFSSLAYVLLNELRLRALQGTELANAYCGTIRLKLLKIAGQVKVTVRNVWVHMSRHHPGRGLFQRAYQALQRAGPAVLAWA